MHYLMFYHFINTFGTIIFCRDGTKYVLFGKFVKKCIQTMDELNIIKIGLESTSNKCNFEEKE